MILLSFSSLITMFLDFLNVVILSMLCWKIKQVKHDLAREDILRFGAQGSPMRKGVVQRLSHVMIVREVWLEYLFGKPMLKVPIAFKFACLKASLIKVLSCCSSFRVKTLKSQLTLALKLIMLERANVL